VRVLMSTFGSEGDLKPPVAIGKMLQQFGAEVDFIANPFFEQRVLSEGLNFIGAGPFVDLDTILKNDPSLLHPIKGPRQVWKMLLDSVEYIFPVACQQIEKQRPDIVVSHAIELATQWAARKYRIPYVTLSTTPLLWCHKDDPVAFGKHLRPEWMNAGALRVLAWVSEFYFSVSTRKLRKRFQLPRAYGEMKSFVSKSVLNLGCWSPLFRPETRDDPVNSLITGFTIERERDPGRIPKELMDWLSQESPPVIVGLGTTARWQGRHIYQAVAEACVELKRRCLLIGPELKDLEDLGRGIRAVREIPYREVFPYACVLVHHGGLGTTAQALFAGCPQLVVPFAHDQFNNAARVKRLGAGLSLPSRKISEKSVKKLFGQILNDQQMNQRTQDLAQQFQQQPYGPNLAAKAILEVLGTKSSALSMF
jgi:rhamnosyltransferase subunit B